MLVGVINEWYRLRVSLSLSISPEKRHWCTFLGIDKNPKNMAKARNWVEAASSAPDVIQGVVVVSASVITCRFASCIFQCLLGKRLSIFGGSSDHKNSSKFHINNVDVGACM